MPRPIFRWSEVTGVFGGTFDPPHLGHRIAIESLRKVPGIQKIILVPSAYPAQKSGRTSSVHRFKMCHLGLGDVATLNDCEIKRSELTERPSYTFDTLGELSQSIADLAFVIGTDQLLNLDTWNRFPDLLSMSHWIVILRGPNAEQEAKQGIQKLVAGGSISKASHITSEFPVWKVCARPNRLLTLVPTSAPHWSSRMIREAIGRSGKPPTGALHPDVESYLKQNRLYGT
jgi:nicotinate (nicotinamide) nucleotide adenylyltransferase